MVVKNISMTFWLGHNQMTPTPPSAEDVVRRLPAGHTDLHQIITRTIMHAIPSRTPYNRAVAKSQALAKEIIAAITPHLRAIAKETK